MMGAVERALAHTDWSDRAAVERMVAEQCAAVDRAVATIANMPPALAVATAATVGAGLGLSSDLQSILTAAAHERLVAHRRSTARDAADERWRQRVDQAKAHARELLAAEWERAARRSQIRSGSGYFFLSVLATAWLPTMTRAQVAVFGWTLLAVAPVPTSRLHAWCNGSLPATDDEIAAFGRAALSDAARMLHEPERATEDDVAVLHALGPAAKIAYGDVEALRVEPMPLPVVVVPEPADEPEPERDEPAAPW